MMFIVTFILSCTLLYFSYTHTENYLKYNTEKFDRLTADRKHYVVKNINKGVYLALLVLFASILVIPDIVWHNKWHNELIKHVASMYVSNDVVGLYMVKNLPTSTRLHHTACIILLMIAWSVDFQETNIGQLLVMYTYFSALSFPVNIYLGTRLCYKKTKWLKNSCKYVYLLSCLINWTIQLKMYIPSEYAMAYFGLILLIVVDDLILLKWLWF